MEKTHLKILSVTQRWLPYPRIFAKKIRMSYFLKHQNRSFEPFTSAKPKQLRGSFATVKGRTTEKDIASSLLKDVCLQLNL